MTLIDEILLSLQNTPSIASKDDFHKLKNSILAKYKVKDGPSHVEMIAQYEVLVASWKIQDDIRMRRVLRKRAVRSLSGVSVISLLTKFWWCPGKCIYCPTYDNLPKSYISDEPAVQRAEMNQFDPFRQIQNRLSSLSITWNTISKCDVRIIWGTWSVYPREYQEDFIKNIYDAHTLFNKKNASRANINPFAKQKDDLWEEQIQSDVLDVSTELIEAPELSKTLEEAKRRNESAESRVIGMAIETRPDWIDIEEIKRIRRYGVTRVEIGYQTTIDRINEINKRWHGNKESINATKLLKDAGFKVVAHMMPGLVGATPADDVTSMKEIFDNPDFRPDELKIYPLVVTPNSELTGMWERGEFTPYDDTTLIPLMAELQWYLPEYIRLNRMYRDIPASEILAWSKLANLRQVTEFAMKARGIARHDISAREIRAKWNDPKTAQFDEYFYESSGWHEWFFQMIDPIDRTIFWLLRLRIPSQIFTGEKHFIEELESAAIIREVHVFGDQLRIGEKWGVWEDGWWGQHMGFGKLLLEKAYEKIHAYYPQCKKIAVIAGVWSRPYYEKRGYNLQNEYMIRTIDR